VSGGYALHPEVFADLDDLRGYIAQDNPDAADRVMSEIFDTIRGLVPFSPSRPPASGPHLAAFAVRSCT
jgi:plasmid stabilization system protein ParE